MNVTDREESALQSAWEHIRDGRAEAALAALDAVPGKLPEVLNARAVALMLLGEHDGAIELLRPLLFPEDGLMMDTNADPARAVNYCLALLRSGNVQGFLTYLPQLPDSDHPGAKALRAVVDDWQDRRKATGWLKRATGSAPSLSLPDDFPPGWREFHSTPRQPGTPPSTAGVRVAPERPREGGTSPLKHTPDKASTPNGSPETTSQGAQSAAKDRVVRVFVSSTFKDMVEDRNELMAQVWPALRKVCRGRSVEFVEVDLRWGVTEEQSQRKETLRHCLAEIKRCRPYFISLLGERYGWTPGSEAYSQALLDEEGWLKNEVAKHSVTELEILHGVLNDPEMAGRAFFYFRDPRYAASKGGDYLSEDAVQPTRQDALKQKVKAVCTAKQIPLRENYADPRALAALVLTDLTAAIDAEFPPDQVPDAWSREDRDHEAYARSRRTDFYVGRDAYFNSLDAYAHDGANGCGLTVLGESGGGKSALLANWVARWRQAHPNDFVFQHYIGSSAMSAGHLALMRRLMVSIVRWCGADDPSGAHGFEEEEKMIPAKADDIVKVFPDYLNRLAAQAKRKGVGAVLVLDALNQIEDRDRGRLLAWLPHRLPGGLRLIVSTLPGDTFNALQSRGWPSLTVEPLLPEERVQLIARYLKHFAQGLSEARARKIAAVTAASNPLYIKTLLDDLRATGDHQKLDQQIADYLKASDIPALLGKILTRYERDYERDRPGLVREALSLLWAARRGLTEPELLEVMKPAGQERLPAAVWSPLRCALEDGLVDRDGVLAFVHEHLRTAVEVAFVSDEDRQDEYRLRLAAYFEVQPITARTCDELPWLLKETESFVRLRVCLLDIDRFLLIRDRDIEELRRYWVEHLEEQQTMGGAYLRAFERWSREPRRQVRRIAYAAHVLGSFLDGAALFDKAEPLMRLVLDIDERISGNDHPNVASDLNNLAGLLKATNRLVEAEAFFRRALKINELSYGENHTEVSICLGNLAGLLQATNRHAEAEPLMRRALAINERYFGGDHPHVATGLNSLAAVLQATNRLTEAEPLMRRALAINERYFGGDNPHVAVALSNLGQLLQKTNRLAEAEALYCRAMEIGEKSYGKEHPHVATTINNLAVLLLATNRLAEAEPLMRRALKIDEQSYGENHPDVARDLNNLAQLLQTTNRLAEAEPLMRRALKINEKSYGENHPDVAGDLNNLAGLLQATDRLAEAEPLFRRALKIHEQSYGENHPDVARDLGNLAGLLQATNRLAEAEPLMRRALKIVEQSYGENHPSVASALNNLAQLLLATNRLAEAEPLMRRALKIDEKSYGENHPDVARDLNNLAQLLQTTNRLAEAEPLYRRALKIVETSLGSEHPNVAACLNSLAQLLQATNRLAEAEPLLRHALKINEQSYGENHTDVAICLGKLAQLLKATNRLAEAEPLYRRALNMIETSLGSEHPNVAVQLSNLAQLLKAANRLAEAEPLMRRALQILETSLGREHPDVATQLNNLAGLFYSTNRLAEAEPLMRRHLEILLNFTRATGRPHPHLQAAFNNYAALLQAMGKPENEVRGTLANLAGRYGFKLRGVGGRDGNGPSPKLHAVLDEIMRDQSKLQEIAARLQREDPALFQELIAFMQSQQQGKQG